MRALFYTGAMESELRDCPDPVAGDGEVHIDVSHCGICGSDMHAWHGNDPRRVPPLILGHEAVGVPRSGDYAGKRVAINPLHTCGECRYCLSGADHICESRKLMSMDLPGAYAEQTVASSTNLYPIPDSLSSEDAALSEPLAVCVHAVGVAEKSLRLPLSEVRCVILGGGAIGVLTALVLVNRGASDVFIGETNPSRREVLGDATSCSVYDPLEFSPPPPVDLVIDCVGSVSTRVASSEIVSGGGTIVHLGLQESGDGLDTRYFTLQEVTFCGSYCYTGSDFGVAVDLLSSGLIRDRGWIDVRPLDSGAQSFLDIHEGRASPKIVLAT